jgi:UDP-N-acetylmuramoyl-L-alanyl-D-glutamate--2,6-diaminopimelate ligase
LHLVLDTPQGAGELHAALLGRFNAANLLAALGALLALGLPLAQALERLSRVRAPAGRMECFGGGEQPLVVVDYAHTPDALEQALGALRAHARGRLWCVFGCGGERDSGKRAAMGEIAERLADHLVITDDNPRGEDPIQIVADILSGMHDPDRAYLHRERSQAIGLALREAGTGDVVLVAGKGHEDYQDVNGVRRAYSDRATVTRLLAEVSA